MTRHVVLWLTVAVYMIAYMDRLVISALVPVIQSDLGFSLTTVGWILGSFRWGYALLQIPAAWIGDRAGPRRTLAAIVAWWSLFTALTAAAAGAVSMAALRFLFGVGQAGAFPIATRSLSRWMLPSERGWAQGVTHAGSRLGGAITPPLAVFLAAAFGWRPALVAFGAIGFVWAAVWLWYYRDSPAAHPRVSAAELHLIRSHLGDARPRPPAPWRAILASATLWRLSAMYFCYAWCVSVYFDWFPKYLNSHRGFDLKTMGLLASLP
ncbi:MAG: MFS transporter, partial [Bryobacteraceae bacterium]